MAGKLHCIKIKEELTDFAHLHIQGSHSFGVHLRVSAVKRKLTEIAWKVSKTKGFLKLREKLWYSFQQTGSRRSIQPQPVVGGNLESISGFEGLILR